MIRVLDLNFKLVAILENAFNVGYERERNIVPTATFTLPETDPKNAKVTNLRYIDIEDVGLYRVMPKLTTRNSSNRTIKYELQHVSSTLFDSVLFKYHQLTNYTTKQVLEYLINAQKTKHWKLGTVEFTRYFHYSWENENLLSAILSVPTPFNEEYRFTFDTSSYPWTINLVRPETVATARIREDYNLQGFTMEENPMGLYNRIYPLGAGEGVNQLDIRKVNGGSYYLQDTASIATYGLHEYIWVDKRFTVAQSLKESAQALLDEWKTPIVNWKISASDLSDITSIDADKLVEGRLVRIIIGQRPPFNLYIIKESRSDIYSGRLDVQLELGNWGEKGSTQTELKRRQQINELYSQGATNILNFGYQDNCDNTIPAVIPFYIDDDVVNVNTIELTYRTKKFRAYSGVTKGGGSLVKSTSSGGSTVKSTSSGGGSTATSSSGGGVVKSTASGGSTTQTSTVNGQSTQTSSAGGDHHHKMFQTTGNGGGEGLPVNATAGGGIVIQLGPNTPTMTDIYTNTSSGNHSHSVTTPAHAHDVNIPAHSHEFSTPNHEHNVTIPNHTHQIDIPNHTHEIDIPDHTHEILHKIVEAPDNPSNVVIKVDGNTVPQTALQGDRVNLAQYANKDTNGNITRGRHEITITPDKIARVEADVILRVFIRSQLGGQL